MNPTADETTKSLKELHIEVSKKIKELKSSSGINDLWEFKAFIGKQIGEIYKLERKVTTKNNNAAFSSAIFKNGIQQNNWFTTEKNIEDTMTEAYMKIRLITGTNEPKWYWEILSFIHENSTYKILLSNTLKIGIDKDYWMAPFNEKTCKIQSVKRLSDGAVFTVGDEYHKDGKIIIIKGFEMHNGELLVDCNNCLYTLYYLTIDFKQPSKKPLFRTEDGKDVFAGDYVYFVDEKRFDYCRVLSEDVVEENKKSLLSPIGFSTLSAAQEYILINKPLFSLNDILNARECETTIGSIIRTNELISTAKDRLNIK